MKAKELLEKYKEMLNDKNEIVRNLKLDADEIRLKIVPIETEMIQIKLFISEIEQTILDELPKKPGRKKGSKNKYTTMKEWAEQNAALDPHGDGYQNWRENGKTEDEIEKEKERIKSLYFPNPEVEKEELNERQAPKKIKIKTVNTEL